MGASTVAVCFFMMFSIEMLTHESFGNKLTPCSTSSKLNFEAKINFQWAKRNRLVIHRCYLQKSSSPTVETSHRTSRNFKWSVKLTPIWKVRYFWSLFQEWLSRTVISRVHHTPVCICYSLWELQTFNWTLCHRLQSAERQRMFDWTVKSLVLCSILASW